MTPIPLVRRLPSDKPSRPDSLVLEAWAQGYMVGSLVILAAVTIANMRKGVILHKLILIELILGMFHGTFIFPSAPVYGWYLSATAILLNTSWSLHNVIAWMKTKPFLTRRWSLFYIGTVILVQPYWILEIYANFTYFNNINNLFHYTRPYEALFRDPWWIFTAINLFYNIINRYNMSLLTIIRISPRFGVLLAALVTSICFIIVDICAVTGVFDSRLPDGLNPFWKLAFVFKCLTDAIVLDDFKTALDRLMRHKLQREAIGSDSWTFIQSNGGNTHPDELFQGLSQAQIPAEQNQALAERTDDLWRSQSLATESGEDPLGDANIDRARNRAAAEPGSPFDRSSRQATARATAIHSGAATPCAPRSPPNGLEEKIQGPTPEEGRVWQQRQWQSIAGLDEEIAATGGRPGNSTSGTAAEGNTDKAHEGWDEVSLPPWPKSRDGSPGDERKSGPKEGG